MSGSTTTSQQIAEGAVKAAPAVGVSAWHYVLGMPVEKWVSVAALLFTVLQIIVLVRKEFWKRKGGRK
jgi:hypothetical protein